MAELVAALLTWIGAQTGLAVPPPPTVVTVSEERMVGLASGLAGARGAYDRDARIVYLRADWNWASLRSHATLLHELAHHVQAHNGVSARCGAEFERQAYDLTIAWLRQQGVADPYALLEIDEFTLTVMTVCPE